MRPEHRVGPKVGLGGAQCVQRSVLHVAGQEQPAPSVGDVDRERPVVDLQRLRGGAARPHAADGHVAGAGEPVPRAEVGDRHAAREQGLDDRVVRPQLATHEGRRDVDAPDAEAGHEGQDVLEVVEVRVAQEHGVDPLDAPRPEGGGDRRLPCPRIRERRAGIVEHDAAVREFEEVGVPAADGQERRAERTGDRASRGPEERRGRYQDDDRQSAARQAEPIAPRPRRQHAIDGQEPRE